MKDQNWAHRRCQRLVWILAGTGVLSGLVVVAVMSWYLWTIRVERIRRDQTAKVSVDVLNAIDQWVTEGVDASKDYLAGKTPAVILPVRQARRREIEKKVRSIRSFGDARDLGVELDQFDKLLLDSRRYAHDARLVASARDQARQQCARYLQGIADTFEDQVKVTQAPEQPASPTSTQKLRRERLPADVAVLKPLSELAVLLERLTSVQDSQELESLRDGELVPLIRRLSQHSEEHPSQRIIGALVADLQSAIWGGSQVVDYEAEIGSVVGLVPLTAQWLNLERSRRRLEERSHERSERLRDFQAELWIAMNKRTDQLATNAADSMFSAWRVVVSTAGFCAVLFLFLAKQIAAVIVLQVAEKEEQTKVLEGEVRDRISAEKERERLNAELQASARFAGMAEVATGVLHNVGNVLNSVNVSANLLRDSTDLPALRSLDRLIMMLSDEQLEFDEHRVDALQFLISEITQSLREQQTIQRQELDGLERHVEHVKSVISMQQRLAARSGGRVLTSARELMDDAVKLNLMSLQQYEIRVLRDYRSNDELLVDKHQILQILVNLVKNSLEAMQEQDAVERVLTLSSWNEEEFVVFEVSDTGHGIPSAQLQQIFQLGYTTKETGHGFGLHHSANVAQESGGSLVAQSDGLGCGAKFQLRLPKSLVATNDHGTTR